MEIDWNTPKFHNISKSKSEKSKKELENHVEEKNNPKMSKLWEDFKHSNDLHESLEICSQIMLLDPSDFRLDLNMAWIYVGLGQYQHADKFFKTSIKKEKDISFSALNDYSEFLIENKRPAESLKCCEEIFKKDPDNIRAQYVTSRIYFETNNFDDALESVERVLEREKDHIPALFTKSMLLNELERYPEAFQVVENALKIDEKNIDILYAKARILYDTNEFEKSLKEIETILEMDENNIDALNAKGDIMMQFAAHNIADVYMEDKNSFEGNESSLPSVHVVAVKYFKKVLSLDPGNYYASYNRCVALFNSGEHRPAIALCTELFRDTGYENYKKLHKELKDALIAGQENYGDLKKQKRNKIILVGILIAVVGFFASISGLMIYRTVVDGGSFGAGPIKILAITTFLLICSIGGLGASIKSFKQQEEDLGYVPKDIPDLN
jgi:tetratricopeptide (TPR) repeat protein